MLFANKGIAQEELPNSRWDVKREIDAITDYKTIYARLRGQTVEISSPRLEDYRNEGATSTITLLCHSSISVRIDAPDNRPLGDLLGQMRFVDRDVIVRFDSEEPEVERWSGSMAQSGPVDWVSDDRSLFAYAYRVNPQTNQDA